MKGTAKLVRYTAASESESKSIFYRAYSIERDSRMTFTRISPGYLRSASILRAMFFASSNAARSLISSGRTNTRTSRPAWIAYALSIQAGREVRVFVRPEEINDLAAFELAKNIARKIEADLKYPGEIRVNVIRESRSIEYAR